MGFCFPVIKERGATARLAWSSLGLLGREQKRALEQRMRACVEALDFHMCHQLAHDLDLPYPLVRARHLVRALECPTCVPTDCKFPDAQRRAWRCSTITWATSLRTTTTWTCPTRWCAPCN